MANIKTGVATSSMFLKKVNEMKGKKLSNLSTAKSLSSKINTTAKADNQHVLDEINGAVAAKIKVGDVLGIESLLNLSFPDALYESYTRTESAVVELIKGAKVSIKSKLTYTDASNAVVEVLIDYETAADYLLYKATKATGTWTVNTNVNSSDIKEEFAVTAIDNTDPAFNYIKVK